MCQNEFYLNPVSGISFFGPHNKHHRVQGLSKYYYLCLDHKLGEGICEIQWISGACVACTAI